MKAYEIWHQSPAGGEETGELFCEKCAVQLGRDLELVPREIPWEALRVRLEMTGHRFVSCSACGWVLLAIP